MTPAVSRRLSVSIVGVGLCPLLPIVTTEPTAGNVLAATPKTCAKLRGRNVVKAATIKVVGQRFRRIYKKGGTQVVGKHFLACALPNGKVYKIGMRYREYLYPGTRKTSPVGSGAAIFSQTVGTFVLVKDQQANLTGDYAEVTERVFNAATGSSYIYHHMLLGTTKKEPAPPEKVWLNGRGQLAGVLVNPPDKGPTEFSDPSPGQSEVVVFSADGHRTILDTAPSAEIPTASLALSDNRVSWSHTGQARTATIP